jgi:peptidyl-prolyl cis-trans isomerase NIMA-interacting 1
MNILLGHEQRIRSGQTTLGDLAISESDCSSARKMGDLGYFGRGDMQKEFEDAAFQLKPGEMSHIVETASGLHLIERYAQCNYSRLSQNSSINTCLLQA